MTSSPAELRHLCNTDLIAFIDHFRAVAGGGIAAAHQAGTHQLDVFILGEDGGLQVSWEIDGGAWQGPVNVSDGFRLTPVRENGHFFPFAYVESKAPHRIPGDGTPTGAFSYDEHMFVAFLHNPLNGQYFSGLSVSSSPFGPQPYDLLWADVASVLRSVPAQSAGTACGR